MKTNKKRTEGKTLKRTVFPELRQKAEKTATKRNKTFGIIFQCLEIIRNFHCLRWRLFSFLPFFGVVVLRVYSYRIFVCNELTHAHNLIYANASKIKSK